MACDWTKGSHRPGIGVLYYHVTRVACLVFHALQQRRRRRSRIRVSGDVARLWGWGQKSGSGAELRWQSR